MTLVFGLLWTGASSLASRLMLVRLGAAATEDALEEDPLWLGWRVREVSLRLGLVGGVAMAAWGWGWATQEGYAGLRSWGGLSRMAAATLIEVAPLTLAVALIWWVGHVIGQRLADSPRPFVGLLRALGAPAWPLAWLLDRLMYGPTAPALAAVPATGPTPPPTPEQEADTDEDVLGGALAPWLAAPDPTWQRWQQTGLEEMDERNRQIYDNAAGLHTVRIRECMVPRVEMVAVDIDEGLEALREAFIQSGYSKVPVYRESIDDVLGYCHASSLFRKPRSIEQILNPIMIVPETMTASQMLLEFGRAQKSLALVIDEYGGTAGLVTMEDVIEEIFGEIYDELDTEQELEQALDERTLLLSGRLEVDYLNEKYGWDLPVGEYESLGGMITHLHEDLPTEGTEVSLPPLTFKVERMEGTRVGAVRLVIDEE